MKKSIILLLLLTACGARHYDNPGVNQAQRNTDVATCKREADRSIAGNSDQMVGIFNWRTTFDDCLQSKGYVPQG